MSDFAKAHSYFSSKEERLKWGPGETRTVIIPKDVKDKIAVIEREDMNGKKYTVLTIGEVTEVLEDGQQVKKELNPGKRLFAKLENALNKGHYHLDITKTQDGKDYEIWPAGESARDFE